MNEFKQLCVGIGIIFLIGAIVVGILIISGCENIKTYPIIINGKTQGVSKDTLNYIRKLEKLNNINLDRNV